MEQIDPVINWNRRTRNEGDIKGVMLTSGTKGCSSEGGGTSRVLQESCGAIQSCDFQ
jgi:hypothetical protein